eukprot:2323170-Rhodomonas_salina.1
MAALSPARLASILHTTLPSAPASHVVASASSTPLHSASRRLWNGSIDPWQPRMPALCWKVGLARESEVRG